MITARSNSIQVGLPRELCDTTTADAASRPWRTAFYKTPIAGIVVVRRDNLDGDAQADRVNHGGPDKAVCVYSADHFSYWQAVMAELLAADGAGDLRSGGVARSGDRAIAQLAAHGVATDALSPGAFGENFTVAGLTEADVCIGDVWRMGEGRGAGGAGRRMRNSEATGAVFQMSQPRQPCWKMARRWGVKTLPARVIESGKTGWYFRVALEGVVAAGMQHTLVERPCPEWTVERANWVMHHEKGDRAAAARLAAATCLSESWGEELRRRSRRAIAMRPIRVGCACHHGAVG